MNPVMEALLLGLCGALFAAGVVVAWHRYRPGARDGDCEEDSGDTVAEYMSMMIALLYAMLLGLALVTVWDLRAGAGSSTADEAGALHQMTVLAEGLPPEQRLRVEGLAQQYAEHVVREEWPRMNRQEDLGDTGWDMLRRMRADAAAPPDATPAQQVTALELLTQLGTLDEARRGREASAQDSLSPVLWVGLVVGAVLSVCILFFFGIGRSASQLVMAMGMVALTVFLGYLIHQLSIPFGDVAGVSTDPFTRYFSVPGAG
ncbi:MULTISPECIES: DUF4239 domain-containing protein [Streptomyces]|uniref:DUF4239 domain-containing protein n=2 Tax=Streptomyces TaxID=1883 RepID=A0A100Y4I7_9ACTN|nr:MULTISPECIES: DUF4239 domain-containing protein [Streptomyces]KUH37500.1 hypothetical protein ATE80_18020 [Streptomyces kanasensis]UUS31726.1 DUF4239 domain-containing protein [Streptomyces changanensis]